MKVLVTGGTGVVGEAAVTELLRHGHSIRLMSRHAEEDSARWPERVEPWPGSVADRETVAGCAHGCDAVLHIAGIVEETPPDVTFQKVNVEGTRNLVREAERSSVQRFVHLSSLGADVGASPYHRSKREAEAIVGGFRGSWTVLRPGNVYGPGDEVISALLQMVRTLPAVPTVSGGSSFQPLWHEDLAEAIAQAVERNDLGSRVLELAGTELTTQDDLIERLREITGRSAPRLPMPDFLAKLAVKAADAVNVDLPISDSKLTMLLEGNVVRAPEGNAMATVFGITPIPLDEGLRRLADAQPEQLPEEGVGTLHHKTWSVDIHSPGADATTLCDRFRAAFGEFVPVEAAAEPGTTDSVAEGASLTLALPLRGNVQVRVEEAGPTHLLLATLQGHPIAGAIRFSFKDLAPESVRFTIDVYDRSATAVDAIGMAAGGSVLQDQTWNTTAERVRDAAGDESSEIRHESGPLAGEAANRVEGWIRGVVNARRRRQDNRV